MFEKMSYRLLDGMPYRMNRLGGAKIEDLIIYNDHLLAGQNPKKGSSNQ
jgi:hypothetical protein